MSYHRGGKIKVSEDTKLNARWLGTKFGLSLDLEGRRREVRDNLHADRSPNTQDDITTGYQTSSLWVDTENNKIFMCVLAIANAAIWIDITDTGFEGESNTASNVGTGVNIYKQKVAHNLQFRTLKGSSTVFVDEQQNEIVLTAPIPQTTADLVEDTNLYYTNARVDQHPTIVSIKAVTESLGTNMVFETICTTSNWETISFIDTEADMIYLVEGRFAGKLLSDSDQSAAYVYNAHYTRKADILRKRSEERLDFETVTGWDVRLNTSLGKISVQVKAVKNVKWKVWLKINSV